MRVGDVVTVVGANDRTYTFPKRITAVYPGGFTASIMPEDTFHTSARNYLTDDEGITWIRGRHDPKSRDVRAMLAANALVAA